METTLKIVGEKPQHRRTTLIFCGGIGMTSLALKQADYEVVGVIDVSKYAEKIYKLNFPDVNFMCASLRELTPEMICDYFDIKPGEVDLIQISNPCTGVSTTGECESFHEVNDLFFVATKLAFALEAKVVVYENVKGLTLSNMSVLFGMIYWFIKKAAPNYYISAKILNSFLFGDAQSRERVFIQCTLKELGRPVWPSPAPLGQRKFIKDIIPEAEYLVSTNFGKRIFYPDMPVPTVTGHPNFEIYDGEDTRNVKPVEYAQFMGLPKDFILEGSIADQNLAIGNGVCIGVMRMLAEVISEELFNMKPTIK